jgi:ribonuclease-3
MPTGPRPESLEELLAELPEDIRRQAFTHSSWVEHRAEAYERLAFLGDVVLSLAVSDHLYPRFERYGAGRLTKVRAQAVSGSSCARVARRLGVPDVLRETAPQGTGRTAEVLLQERLARRAEVVAYRTVSEEGPAHDRSFIAVAEVAGQELGRGEGKTKKAAEQEAALHALDTLDEEMSTAT